MSEHVKMRGMDKVLRHLKQIKNPDKLFDSAVRKTAVNSMRGLIEGSLSKSPQIRGMNTGTTARAWTSPLRKAGAFYQVKNEYKNGKYNIARIINDGHKAIKPRKKYLYIPLNKTAAQKRPGANIPESLKQGTDFVFAKKVKAKKGTGFIDKNIIESSRELTRRVIAEIRKVYKT